MASPTTAIQRMDLSLSYSEFNLLANQRKFIGLQVLPPVSVAEESSTFAKLVVKSVLGPIRDTKRAPKTAYKRDDFEWTTDSYKTEDHGWEAEIDDRQVKRYGSEIRAERIAAMRAVNNVLMAYENEVAAAVFNTTTWTGASKTAAAAAAWTVKATADPIADIDNAYEKVVANCGMAPNTVILSDIALRAMVRTDRLEDLLKYSGSDDPKALYNALPALAELLRVERILVGQGFKNTANEGQTASISRLWNSTMAMVCHINNDGMDGDLEAGVPNIGRTIMWQEEAAPLPGDGSGQIGVLIEEYRDDAHRGNVMRARNDRQVKILHPEAGFLITAVTA